MSISCIIRVSMAEDDAVGGMEEVEGDMEDCRAGSTAFPSVSSASTSPLGKGLGLAMPRSAEGAVGSCNVSNGAAAAEAPVIIHRGLHCEKAGVEEKAGLAPESREERGEGREWESSFP